MRVFTPVFAGYAKPMNRRRWVSQELNPPLYQRNISSRSGSTAPNQTA
jgi:hypothetical protein